MLLLTIVLLLIKCLFCLCGRGLVLIDNDYSGYYFEMDFIVTLSPYAYNNDNYCISVSNISSAGHATIVGNFQSDNNIDFPSDLQIVFNPVNQYIGSNSNGISTTELANTTDYGFTGYLEPSSNELSTEFNQICFYNNCGGTSGSCGSRVNTFSGDIQVYGMLIETHESATGLVSYTQYSDQLRIDFNVTLYSWIYNSTYCFKIPYTSKFDDTYFEGNFYDTESHDLKDLEIYFLPTSEYIGLDFGDFAYTSLSVWPQSYFFSSLVPMDSGLITADITPGFNKVCFANNCGDEAGCSVNDGSNYGGYNRFIGYIDLYGITVNSPTTSPTTSPTFSPTTNPTKKPTVQPSKVPTFRPSASPTVSPTVLPSVFPSFSPTNLPTLSPSNLPSSFPTLSPTFFPSVNPTYSPSLNPTLSPSINPSYLQTDIPSIVTSYPSISPTVLPNVNPTVAPSTTEEPTVDPTSIAETVTSTAIPTNFPSANPTLLPTSITPTVEPSNVPSTVFPTSFPISSPSSSPSFSPVSSLTVSPTTFPTTSPISPSITPSSYVPTNSIISVYPTISLTNINPTTSPNYEYPSTYPTFYESYTWSSISSSKATSWNDICTSITGQYVYAVASYDYIYKSSDYSNSYSIAYDNKQVWTAIETSESGDIVVAAAFHGYIYISGDYGVSWSVVFEESRLWSGLSISQTNYSCYAIAKNDYIYKLVDGGKSSKVVNLYSAYWTGITTDKNRITYAVAKDGFIWQSLNDIWKIVNHNRRTWSAIATNYYGNYVYATVNVGHIYVSTDYGVTWRVSYSKNSFWNSITVNNNLIAYACDTLGTIVMSNNGSSWQEVYKSSSLFTSVSLSSYLNFAYITSFNDHLYYHATYFPTGIPTSL